MFSVYLCNSAYVKDRILIYADERSDEDELKLIGPKLTMEVNQAGSFEFGIPVGNAGYDDIEPMISEILVMREDPATVSAKRWRGGILWFGRVISMTTDVWNTKQCYCEGGLSYLNDVIATSFSTSRNLSSVSIGEALMTRTKNSVEKVHYNVYPDHDFSGQMRKYCLTNYGSNVKDHYLKYLGFASYYDATKNYIWTVEPVIYQYGDDTKHYYQRKQGLYVWNDLSILELITNVVGDDGYYWMEKGEVTVDDYTDAIMVNQLHLTQSYAEFNEDRHQTFHIGENIIDYVKEDDMTDIYTAVHPYGTADGDDHTTTLHFSTDEYYTTTNKQIKLKYSKDYPGIIYRPDLVKRYGMVVKNLDVGSYYAQEQLVMYTLSYFDSQNLIETTIEKDGKTRIITFRTLEIKAADMGMMGADYSMIQLMDPVHVVSEIHDVDLYANVTKIEIDLQSPENSIYTINSSTTGSSIYNGTGSSVTGGSTPAGSSYRHPRHTAHELGLWKIENDNLGHVTNAQAVNKKDITDLGIPGEDTNTTYELSKDGNTIKMTGSDGSTSEVEVEGGSDTTYTLTKNGDKITLTGSDGTAYTVDDSDTVYTHPKFTEYANGLYKVTVNDEGHVTEAVGVTKDDITALGIPGEDNDTTYIIYSEPVDGKLEIKRKKNVNGSFVDQLRIASITWYGSSALRDDSITFSGYMYGIMFDGESYAPTTSGAIGNQLSVKITPTGATGVYGHTVLNATYPSSNTFTLTSSIESAPAKWNSITNPTRVKIGYDTSTGSAELITDFANDILVHNVVGHDNNTVTGKKNLVEGSGNTVSGNSNLVGGSSNTVTAIESIVNGGSNTVGGERNVVVGASNTASGINCATFGHGNVNKSDHGFVVNFDNTLTEHAASSTVTGYVNYCDATCQFICGRYNKKDPGVYDTGWKTYYGKYALIVGNGGSTEERSNAFAVDWDGNLWCGNDTTSLNAQIKSKAESTELAKYLPLTGGTMSGNINLATNQVDLLVGSQPATQSIAPSAVAGGAIGAKISFGVGAPARKSIVGTWLDENNIWHDIISVRHRNGHGDGTNYGMYLRSLLTAGGNLIWNKQTAANTWQGERALLDTANYSTYAAKSDHTHAAITNRSQWASGANNAAQWVRLGTVVSSGNFSTAVISVWSGNGANGNASQNSWFEIHIKDGWQSTESSANACGVTVYRTHCSTVKVKVIPTAHNTYTVWVYLPWPYWNGNYAVTGKYSSWTPQVLKQTAEPDGTAADTAYYDQAFLTSTVANATAWDGLTQDCDTYNSADTWLLVKNGNKIQHRLSYELVVKQAATLTETAWTAVPTTGAAAMSNNRLTYKKVGQIVFVRGSIVFSAAQSAPCVGTLPAGYRPDQKMYMTGWQGDKVTAFGIVVNSSGKINLQAPSSSAGWFDTTRSFYVDISFCVT